MKARKRRTVKEAVKSLFKKKVVSVNLSERAFLKTVGLVEGYEGEVGWHGTVKRLSDNSFEIEDIFVYPQIASPASIDTDQFGYEKWLMGLDNETFNGLRVHGHSHVNFATMPSVKDDAHRGAIVEKLRGDMFYIFMIWNKRLEVHTLVYDCEPKLRYGNSDLNITVTMDGECVPLKDVDMKKAKALYDENNVTEFVDRSREVVQQWSLKAREGSRAAWEQAL